MIYIARKPMFRKTNPGSFGTPLVCPFCNSKATKRSRWKYIENIGPFRIRYQCKDCGSFVQYDFANNNNFIQNHPYSPYKKNKYQRKVEAFKQKQKSLLKGQSR